MFASLLLLACAAPTVDVGWQQLEDGSYEYIIQIEPDQLDAMRAGRDIFSDLPPALKHIRRYRITVGNAPLPHEGVPPELIGSPPVGRPDDAPARGAESPMTDNVAGGPTLIGPRNSLPLSAMPGPGEDEPPPVVAGPTILEAEVVVEESADEEVAAEQPPAVETPVPAEQPTFVIAAEEDTPAPDLPKPFDAPNDSRPLVEPTSTTVAVASPRPTETEAAKPSLAGEVVPNEQPIGWALSAALVGLFVSLGANIYMTWITLGTRYRYRELITRMRRQSTKAA